MSLHQQKPVVRINVNVTSQGTRFLFNLLSRSGDEVIEVNTAVTSEDWNKIRTNWQKELNDFRDFLDAGSSLLDPPVGGRSLKVLEDLRDGGELLFRRLFRYGNSGGADLASSPNDLARARAAMARVLRDEHGFDYGAERFVDTGTYSRTAHPPFVAIHCRDEDLFPWETLPWLPRLEEVVDPARTPDVTQKIVDLARCFLGFCAITFRTNPEVPRVPSGCFNAGLGLSVTSYMGADLPSQPQELRFLDQLAHVKAHPWTLRCRLDRRARGAFCCWSAFAYEALQKTSFIHHFAAHGHEPGRTAGTASRRQPAHLLHLLPGKHQWRGAVARNLGGKTHQLPLNKLAARIFRLLKRNGVPAPRRNPSLVFLNLCSSGALQGRYKKSVVSLPTLVRLMGHSACIVTEARVGHDFASAFAERFYVAFLHGVGTGTGGGPALSAGEALLWTKWHFLRLYRNPQGLLYSLRGRPEIRVRQPIAYVFPK